MQPQDKKQFSNTMNECADVYDITLTAIKMRVWWGLLIDMSIDEFLVAINAHMQDPDRGRFFPRPADIIAKKTAANPHLSADEAWAIAMISFDESETVVWTREIAEARSAAFPVWVSGDTIGARVAFRSAYERIMSQHHTVMPIWTVCLGFDHDRRTTAIQQAVQTGRMEHRHVAHLLPASKPTADGQAIAGLLTGNVTAIPTNNKTRERLGALRTVIEKTTADNKAREEAERQAAKQKFEAEKKRQLDALKAWEREHVTPEGEKAAMEKINNCRDDAA